MRFVRWVKSKCAALRWLCALGCSSFDFAEALVFCLSFFCSFCVGRVVFRVRHNVLAALRRSGLESRNFQLSTNPSKAIFLFANLHFFWK